MWSTEEERLATEDDVGRKIVEIRVGNAKQLNEDPRIDALDGLTNVQNDREHGEDTTFQTLGGAAGDDCQRGQHLDGQERFSNKFAGEGQELGRKTEGCVSTGSDKRRRDVERERDDSCPEHEGLEVDIREDGTVHEYGDDTSNGVHELDTTHEFRLEVQDVDVVEEECVVEIGADTEHEESQQRYPDHVFAQNVADKHPVVGLRDARDLAAKEVADNGLVPAEDQDQSGNRDDGEGAEEDGWGRDSEQRTGEPGGHHATSRTEQEELRHQFRSGHATSTGSAFDKKGLCDGHDTGTTNDVRDQERHGRPKGHATAETERHVRCELDKGVDDQIRLTALTIDRHGIGEKGPERLEQPWRHGHRDIETNLRRTHIVRIFHQIEDRKERTLLETFREHSRGDDGIFGIPSAEAVHERAACSRHRRAVIAWLVGRVHTGHTGETDQLVGRRHVGRFFRGATEQSAPILVEKPKTKSRFWSKKNLNFEAKM